MDNHEVTVTLTADEALVLFEWIHRHEDADTLEAITVDQSEVIALWALSAALERGLVPPFQADYAEQLRAAQVRLQGALPLTDPEPRSDT